jgi:hypothetical protein
MNFTTAYTSVPEEIAAPYNIIDAVQSGVFIGFAACHLRRSGVLP